MPKTLPINLIAEKNKLNMDDPWLVFLHIAMPASDDLYYVNNTEDATWGGQLYTALPFQLGVQKYSNTSVIPSIELKLSNVNRVLQPYIDALDGGMGAEVSISIVSMAHLTESYSELTIELEIISTLCDDQFVTFSLGAPNPMRQRFPTYKYISHSCNWVRHFKGDECTYSGVDTTCEGTLDDCQSKSNSHRFGGFKGLDPSGIQVAR